VLESQIAKLIQEIQGLKTISDKTAEQKKEFTEKEKELARLKRKTKQKTKTLLILAQQEEKKVELMRSFRNLPYLRISDSSSINLLQVLSPHLIFTQLAFSELEKRLRKIIKCAKCQNNAEIDPRFRRSCQKSVAKIKFPRSGQPQYPHCNGG
ncbi:6454_t:CDS:2, partial [Funneliformis geosporum]